MNELNVKSSNRNEQVRFAPEDRAFVYAVARRIVRTPEDAEDVAQDALLLAFRYRDAFRGDSKYRTWLYRIAATTALGHLRSKRRLRTQLSEDGNLENTELADPAPSPEATVAEREDHALVAQALRELPPTYRDVLLARAEATEPEVAQQLGISIANVKIRAHRARKQLRSVIDRVAA